MAMEDKNSLGSTGGAMPQQDTTKRCGGSNQLVLFRGFMVAALALTLTGMAPKASGEIFPYNDIRLEPGQVVYREAGMFAPGKGFLEMGAGRGDGESFIRLTELKFEAWGSEGCGDDERFLGTCTPGHIDVAIFEQRSFNNVGVAVNKTRYYCCDYDAIQQGACASDHRGEVLLSDTSDIWWRERLLLAPGTPASLDDNKLYRIPETGMYVVLLANCDANTGDILINGHSEWKDPYGYLPGEEYGNLPFFLVLSVVYLALGVVWMVFCMMYIKELLAIQMWASLVLLLGMVETGAQYFYYRVWNIEGSRPPGAQAFGILFGAAKRALSLSLVLMVCMGYGLVRPSLGRDVHKIMGLALLYFVSSGLLDAHRGSSTGDREFASRTRIDIGALLVFINCTIIVLFYLWILQSIFGVIEHLRSRGQTVKLNLYVQFRYVLGASMVFAVGWISFFLVLSSEEETDRRWETYWTVDAIWEMVYLGVLMAVCFLLRPSMNNQRFSYSSVPMLAKEGEEDGGDILLRDINDEEAEYGGSLEGEDKDDEFSVPVPGQKGKTFMKKENQD